MFASFVQFQFTFSRCQSWPVSTVVHSSSVSSALSDPNDGMSISSFINKTSLLTGRINSPDDVFHSTTRTILSFPTKTFVIRGIGHKVGGVFSSLIITRSLMSIFVSHVCHFFRFCKFGKDSVDHFFQKSLIRLSILFFCRVNEIVSFPFFGSGSAVIGRSIKKCPDVSANASLASFETDEISLEFTIASF